MRETDTDGGTVMVTGASRGLGAAVTRALTEAGRPVSICATSQRSLEEIDAELDRAGARFLSMPVDVTDADAVRGWVDRTRAVLGEPAAIVNNASVLGPRSPLADYPEAEWRRAIDVNLNGVFLVTRAVLPQMIAARRGAIINVTSGAAIPPRKDWGAYAVSKAAVEALSLNLAAELDGTGVTVAMLDPGAMRTEMRAAAYPHEDPLRLKTAEETARVVTWMIANACDLNGTRVQADEWLARHPTP